MGRKVIRYSTALVLLLSLWVSVSGGAENRSSNCQHDRSAFRCVRVVKNYDGDTLTVDIPGVHPLLGDRVSVRVMGVDTPEIKGKGKCEKDAARVAKNLVSATLRSGKRVDLVNVQRDKYFRVLADVYVDGISLKDILLKNRVAYAYDGGTKSQVNWCDAARRPAASP